MLFPYRSLQSIKKSSLWYTVDPYSLSILYTLMDCCLLVAQLHLTLCDPMDFSPSGSSVHGILRARILEWVVIPFSRESS